MYCKQCGMELKENEIFCTNCGMKRDNEPSFSFDERTSPDFNYQQQFSQSWQQQEPSYMQQSYGMNNERAHNGSVTFGEAIKLFFKNYTNFNGRASKSEYWWIFLFNTLIGAVLGTIIIILPQMQALYSLYLLATIIPDISLAVRRLHDIGKKGTYYFFIFIPLAGAIILFAYMLKDSVGDNQWGPGPTIGSRI